MKITLIPAPSNDHRAIGLVERLISTIKQRLACIKEANKEISSFTIKTAFKTIFYLLRICKHRITKISPHLLSLIFGKLWAKILLSNISTKPHYSELSFENILSHYLDKEIVTPNELLAEDHWGNYRSDEEVERNLCKATKKNFSHVNDSLLIINLGCFARRRYIEQSHSKSQQFN